MKKTPAMVPRVPKQRGSPSCRNTTWLEKRREREGALIGLIGTAKDPKTDTASKHRYLRQIAERGRMDYLSTDLSAAPEAVADSIESIHQRADQITSVLDEILSHIPTHPAPPRRGIDR